MTLTWEPGPGVVELPSGRRVRGRSRQLPDDGLAQFVLVLGGRPRSTDPEREPTGRRVRRVAWPDFWVPTDRADARAALAEAHRRAETERVQVSCRGGRGRTGTALAVLATLDGLTPTDAVDWIRRTYHPGAVETPWQRRYVATWANPGRGHDRFRDGRRPG